MNNINCNVYWKSCLYPLFLSTLASCTFASYSDEELQAELDNFALRAIAKFKFPKISLDFKYDDRYESGFKPKDADSAYPSDEDTTERRGYYFLNDITIKEITVIISWMKVYWLEYQLSKERLYKDTIYDKDVKAFSNGNLISSIEKALYAFKTLAKETEMDYGRVNTNNKPSIGDINV